MSAQPTPERMAAFVMERLDLWSPLHRFHHRRDQRCPWCVIMRVPPLPDSRSDEEILLASAGALS